MALVLAVLFLPACAQTNVTPTEARAIAKDAYIYGFSVVDSYRVQHAYFVDRDNPEFKAPWNQIRNTPRVYTPEDKAIQTPNSDTPYSMLGMDLRAEPIVLTVPIIEKSRYFSVQLIDAYTHNFAYLGSRATGNDGGRFLLAGPGWKGETPDGIKAVIQSETELVFAMYRTQLFNPDDLDNVKQVQAGYKVQTLSQFVGKPAPKAAPAIDFIDPLTPELQRTSLEFFNVLNFALRFCPTHPSEKELMARFARLGIGEDKTFDAAKLSPEIRKAVEDGMADAWKDFGVLMKRITSGELSTGDAFGTRKHLKNNYLFRMAAAVLGIYGNSAEEAIYPSYHVDAAGQMLDALKNRYSLRFAPGQLPPVNAFWSLTMYELPSSLLTANPLNRYLINSPMLPDLKKDADGGITLYVQNDSPGKDKESNWLPAPNGPFFSVLRLYWPKQDALDGTWKQPPLLAAAQDQAASSVTVTPETYIRAETDRAFLGGAMQAGGVNLFDHHRAPTPVDQQPIVRMNKDTLYSGAIIDTEGGATITIPEIPGDRYVSVLLIDNDHYVPFVIYTAGTHKLPQDTKYLGALIRLQIFDANDQAEIAQVNKLQDQFVITANSADPLPPFKWNMASLLTLTEQYEKEAHQLENYNGMQGPRGKLVKEKSRHLAAAAGWGLFPEQDAIYLNYNGGHDDQQCYQASYQIPDNNAFWSITVYGSDGYMKSDNVVGNSSNVKLNADGTFTVHYGSKEVCGDVPNRLDVTEGWNFLMRIYRPGPSVVDGTYKLPNAEPVK
jgi:hypothetical protein